MRLFDIVQSKQANARQATSVGTYKAVKKDGSLTRKMYTYRIANTYTDVPSNSTCIFPKMREKAQNAKIPCAQEQNRVWSKRIEIGRQYVPLFLLKNHVDMPCVHR